MNQVDLWMQRISWKCGALKRRRAIALDEKELLGLIFHGTPQESGSNYCLWALMKSKLLDQCRISDGCLRVLLRDDGTTGFPLTHRLLYVQTASAVSFLLLSSTLIFQQRIKRGGPTFWPSWERNPFAIVNCSSIAGQSCNRYFPTWLRLIARWFFTI